MGKRLDRPVPQRRRTRTNEPCREQLSLNGAGPSTPFATFSRSYLTGAVDSIGCGVIHRCGARIEPFGRHPACRGRRLSTSATDPQIITEVIDTRGRPSIRLLLERPIEGCPESSRINGPLINHHFLVTLPAERCLWVS